MHEKCADPERGNDLNFAITEDCIPKIRRARFDPARNSQLSRVNGGYEKYRKQLVRIAESPATGERCFRTG